MVAIEEKSQTQPPAKFPNGPKGNILLQTVRSILNPLEVLEAAARKYGDIFTGRSLGFPPFVVISNPQGIQEIFTADANCFESDKSSNLLSPILGENSLTVLDGARHASERKLLMPPFHGERMKAYGKTICDIAEQVMSEWEIGKTAPIHPSMQEISLGVIIRVVFGIEEGQRFGEIKNLLKKMLNIFDSPLSSSLLFFRILQKDLGAWSPWGRFLRLRSAIDELLYAEIAERREKPDPNRTDILSMMMSARDENGEPMTDVELRDELMTLLFAGHETTASSLAWAFYWIHRQPEIREKILAELENLGSKPDPVEIARLPYLSAVCSETLRIYPIVLFSLGRLVKTPIQLMGYHIEPGTFLAPCIYLTHHREDIYPEPKRFKPERFLERQFSPYEYFPFGGGNRRCLGMALAQFEMKLVLATILSRFQLALAEKHSVKPVRRGVTMTPSGGVKMTVSDRL